MEATLQYDNPSPETTANIFSKIFFCWMLPFVRYGCGNNVEMKDIYNTSKKNKSENLGDILERYWKNEVKKCSKTNNVPSLQKVILKSFGLSYMKIGLLILFQLIVIKCSLPYILREYIRYFQKTNAKIETGWILGVSIFLLYLLGTIAFANYCACCEIVGLKVKVACCSLVYRKILKLSLTSLNQAAAGEIINLLSNDVQRIESGALYLHFIYAVPLQVIVMVYVVYDIVGIAGIPGILFIIIEGLPVQGFLSKIQGKLRSKIALLTGKRLALMNDIVSGIHVIKMYAWEKPFEAVIATARRLELKVIDKACYIKAFAVAMVMFTERFSLFLTVVTYVLLGNRLTGDVVFAVVVLLNLIQASLCYYLPLGFESYAEIKVSIARLEEFLLLEEKLPTASTEKISKDTGSIKLEDVRAGWIPNSLTLSDITLNINQGTLCCVLGKVGAGKSSFLHLLLRELPLSSGNVDITGRISYASQEPWLFVGSVRNNILFGQKFLHNKYQEVVKVCALYKDFQQFPYRDQTIIGERGVSLSGGQRARINLARAVYVDADIYLLDDPLSAVDTRVAKHLYEECIMKYLHNKTRILVTHQLQFLKKADLIVVLEEGKIINVTKHGEGFESNLDQFNEVLSEEQDENSKEEVVKHSMLKRTVTASKHNILQRTLTVMSHSGTDYEDYEDERDDDNEEVLSKDVSFSSYFKYFSSGTNVCVLMFLLLLFLISQVIVHMADVWIMIWTNKEEDVLHSHGKYNSTETVVYLLPKNNASTSLPIANDSKTHYDTHIPEEYSYYIYLYVYSGLILVCIIVSIIRPIFFCKVCINASRALHDRMFKSVLLAPMRFFETNPSGRIMNRFSKDLGSVDEIIPSAMLWTLQIWLVLIGFLIVICIIVPWMLIPLFVVGVGTYYIIVVCFPTLLKMVKLGANNRSPIFSHISATVNGLATIRSAEAETTVRLYFESLQDIRTSTEQMLILFSKTFCFYLESLWIVFLAVVIFKFLVFKTEKTYGGHIGLVISDSSIVAVLLQYGIMKTAEVVSNMISVERILQYNDIEREDAQDMAKREELMRRWPHSGKITFNKVCLSYAPGDPPVLYNLSLDIKPGEKIGIVGRTGAGKSSLIACLFRLAFVEGTIAIDDIDTTTIDINNLRSNISIIPQEPVLFSETLRYNLDPLGKASDEVLWKVLENVKLKGSIDNLDQAVSSGGINFSAGQRQLICLARAILKNNKILVMDEATANVDQNTDALIQQTIRENFRSCTVLTIAHRLNTIMDSDRVLVMNAGRAVEFAHPHELLKNAKSYFSDMVKETGKGMEENLRHIAKEDYERKFFDTS